MADLKSEVGGVDSNERADSKGRFSVVSKGAAELSLGISIVVAVLLGVGLGWLIARLSGIWWLIFLGVFWGVGAAVVNIIRAYKRMSRELDELAQNPRYTHAPSHRHCEP